MRTEDELNALTEKIMAERQTCMDRVINRLLDKGARQDDIEIQYHPDCVRIICWNEKVAEYSISSREDEILLHGFEKTWGGTAYFVQGGKPLHSRR